MTTGADTLERDPGYVRELLAVIRELTDAAIAARPYVLSASRRLLGSETDPAGMLAARTLDQLDGAIAEGQERA